MKYTLALLLLCSVCWAGDLPLLPEGGPPKGKLSQMQEAYNAYASLQTWRIQCTYEVKNAEGKIVQNYALDIAFDGTSKTRSKLTVIVPPDSKYYWSVEEIYSRGATWTYSAGPEGRVGTIDADVDGRRVPHPLFTIPLQEVKRTIYAGAPPLKGIEYTHYLTGLDTTKYPMSTAYVRMGRGDWVMAFIDEKTALPQQIWRNEINYDGAQYEGHETIKFSAWKVDDKKRPYPSDMTYDCRIKGKVVATLHLTIQDFTQTVDPKWFDFPKEFPELTHVVLDGKRESQYDVPLKEKP